MHGDQPRCVRETRLDLKARPFLEEPEIQKEEKFWAFLACSLCSFYYPSKNNMSVRDSDSDVSELDRREISDALAAEKWAPQLGYCEDPETPLTADSFPSKSGGKPV